MNISQLSHIIAYILSKWLYFPFSVGLGQKDLEKKKSMIIGSTILFIPNNSPKGGIIVYIYI